MSYFLASLQRPQATQCPRKLAAQSDRDCSSGFSARALMGNGLPALFRISPTSFLQAGTPLISRYAVKNSNRPKVAHSGATAGPSATGMARNPLGFARIECAALLAPPGDGRSVTKSCVIRDKTISRRASSYSLDSRNCSLVSEIILPVEAPLGVPLLRFDGRLTPRQFLAVRPWGPFSPIAQIIHPATLLAVHL